MTARSHGVLYVATGERHRREMAASLATLRAVHPEMPVALATDAPAEAPGGLDAVLPLEGARCDYGDKVRGMLAAPFERTLFLDTDTHVCGPLDDVFPLLDRFDIALGREGGQDPGAPPSPAAAMDELNSGVMLFRRSPAVAALLADWLERYERDRRGPAPAPNDQRSLRDAIWHADVRLYVLPSEYNFLVWIPQFVQGGRAVRVLHGRRPDFDLAGRQVNRFLVPRVFVPSLMFLHVATLGILGRRGGRLMRAWTAFARAVEPLTWRRRSPRAIDPFTVPPRPAPPR